MLLKILNLAEPFYPVDKLMARQDCALFTLASSFLFLFPFFHPSFLLCLLPFLPTFLIFLSLASLSPVFPFFLSFIYLSGHLRIYRSEFVTNKQTNKQVLENRSMLQNFTSFAPRLSSVLHYFKMQKMRSPTFTSNRLTLDIHITKR